MRRDPPRIADLYQSDLDRHLFAPQPRKRQPLSATWLAGWLRAAVAVAAWGLLSGR